MFREAIGSIVPHDSFHQDLRNREMGMQLGQDGVDCRAAALRALRNRGLDLSAPPAELWDPQHGKYPDPAALGDRYAGATPSVAGPVVA